MKKFVFTFVALVMSIAVNAQTIKVYKNGDVIGTYNDIDSITFVAEEDIAVSGIKLDKTSLSLTEGETTSLVATVSPNDATDKSVNWKSSNASVASVDANGKVTAIGAGSATITVTTNDGNYKASCTVNVITATIYVNGISLNTSSLSLTVGETTSLVATVSPSDATDKSVAWTSDNASVATVDQNGKITALSSGSAIITVSAQDGSGKKATCSVTVKEASVSVESISINKVGMSLSVGSTEQLQVSTIPVNATDKSVVWSSGNTNVASVDPNGIVTAIAVGTAIITATSVDGNFTATCNVNVSEKYQPGNTPSILMGEYTLGYMPDDPTDVATYLAPNLSNATMQEWTSGNIETTEEAPQYSYEFVLIPNTDTYSGKAGKIFVNLTQSYDAFSEYPEKYYIVDGDKNITYNGVSYRVYSLFSKFTGILATAWTFGIQ